MLTPDQIKVAIVMILRAPLKGDEARNVVATLDALEREYADLTNPQTPATLGAEVSTEE